MDDKYHPRNLCPDLVLKQMELEQRKPLLDDIKHAIKTAATPESAKQFERQLAMYRDAISTLENDIATLQKTYDKELARVRKRNRDR